VLGALSAGPAHSLPPVPTEASDSLRASLQNRVTALRTELSETVANPRGYYLVIDIPASVVQLKSGARTLRSCPIVAHSFGPGARRTTRTHTVTGVVPPVTAEPGNAGQRLRGRRLPLDFMDRLVGGPRRASRLYLSPRLLLQPDWLPTPNGLSTVSLRGPDLKALGSALARGATAIVVPPLPATARPRGSG